MKVDSSLLEAIPDSLIVCSRQGDILWCNTQLEKLLAYRREELVSRKVEMLLPSSLRELHQRHRQDYAKNPTHRPMGNAAELFARSKDGQKIPIDIELAPLNWHGEDCIAAVLRCRVTKLSIEAKQQTLLRENEERLRRSQAIAKIGTWDWDVTEDNVTWSDEIFHILALPLDFRVKGIQTVFDLVLADDMALFQQHISSASLQEGAFTFEHRINRADGSVRYIRQNGEAYLNKQGELVRMLGTAQDVSEERKRRRELQLSQAIFENANDGILATDANFRIISVNSIVEKLCACKADQLIGQHIMKLAPLYAQKELSKKLSEVVLVKGSWRGEAEIFLKNAPNVPVMASVALLKSDQGKTDGCVVTITDISKLKLNEAQLDFLAHYDQLTRLPNRTMLHRELTRRTRKVSITDSRLYILYIDLDGFKQINDSQGHSAGDELLFEVAEQLRSCVPEGALVARLGGDEFAIVCEFSETENVETLARRVIRRLQLRKEFDDLSVSISASVGIACCPKDGVEPLELIKKADQAMYEAKASGRNGFEHYSESVGHQLRYKLQMVSDLSDALNQQAFSIVVQPKLIVANKGAYSVEVLSRWMHPKRGSIAPDEFIALAEESGKIIDLGRQVLNKSARFIAQWKARYDDEITVAINLSAKQLHDENLVDDVAVIFARHGVCPSCIEFEVTESVVMDDVESSLRVFGGLKKMGSRIAIDDFGTGYSSLSYLKKLPVDVLKIDRSFIAHLPENKDDMAIATAIISMAKSLKIELVAEGVETQGQYRLLGSLGCEQLQGFYFSRPKALQDYLQNPWSINAEDVLTFEI